MNTPKISVIIPIYNDELYLNDTLQSVQNQIFTNFECLCINDGSTDKTEEIIDKFVKKDSRFVKINQENGGVSAARNTGLNAAKGEYLFFIDHDDLIPNYTLENLLSAAEKFGADMARGRMMMIAENCTTEELPKSNSQNKKERFFDNPLTDFYRHIRRKYKLWCYVWQCLFKRSVIKNIRFVEELRAGGEDNLFMFEVVSKIKNFVQIDDIVACHRFSKISITLNGFNPVLIRNFDTMIPYIYKKYAVAENIDKRLLWWVYHKVSYSTYRFLIRDTVRKGGVEHRSLAKEILLRHNGTPELNKIMKLWSFRQKIFCRLFMNEKYKDLRFFKMIM